MDTLRGVRKASGEKFHMICNCLSVSLFLSLSQSVLLFPKPTALKNQAGFFIFGTSHKASSLTLSRQRITLTSRNQQ
jgi:hypothetical protein